MISKSLTEAIIFLYIKHQFNYYYLLLKYSDDSEIKQHDWMFQVMWQSLTNQSRVTTLPIAGRPLLLRGFVCAYHPAAAGSNPKHTILVFYKKNFAFDSTTTKLEAARRVMDILCI